VSELKVRKVNGSYSGKPQGGYRPPRFNESRSKALSQHLKMPAEASKARQGSGENQGLK
jgi:hypothetical protein